MSHDKKTNVQTGDTSPPPVSSTVNDNDPWTEAYLSITSQDIRSPRFCFVLLVCFLPLKNFYKENSRLHAKEMGMGNTVVKWDDIRIFGKITEPEIWGDMSLKLWKKMFFSAQFSKVLKYQAKEFRL